VVRYLAAEAGIRQFLDIGTGLPAPAGTHEVAQTVARESRIVYVDNDPLVLVYARAQLTGSREGACGYVDADVRDVGTILEQAARTFDFSKPVAVLLLAILHLLPDADSPAAIVARLARGLAPASYVAISHMTADFAPDQVIAAANAYNALAPVPVTARTHSEVIPWIEELREAALPGRPEGADARRDVVAFGVVPPARKDRDLRCSAQPEAASQGTATPTFLSCDGQGSRRSRASSGRTLYAGPGAGRVLTMVVRRWPRLSAGVLAGGSRRRSPWRYPRAVRGLGARRGHRRL
jgi:hypothetical protein